MGVLTDKLISSGKKIFYIKTILLCSLTAIIILHLLSSLPGLYHSIKVFTQSKHIGYLNDVSDDLFTAVGNYGFERGRVNVVLNDAGPVKKMERNRQFIIARRTEGDKALNYALKKLSENVPGNIKSKMATVTGLKEKINQLRVLTDKNLVVTKKERESGLAEVWFEAMTRYIKSIEALLVTISRDISDSDGIISRYSSLKHETLALRNTAGPEMSILSATILSQKPIKPHLAKKIDSLHILTKHHFEKISFLSQGLSESLISGGLKRLKDIYFKDYLPYRDTVFPLALTGGPYPYSQKEFLGHGVVALNEIANFMDLIITDTKVYTTKRLHQTRTKILYAFLNSIGSLIAVVLIILFVNYKVIIPIGQLRNAVKRLAENDLEVAVPMLKEINEIGQMARALEIFKHMAVQLDKDNALLKTAEERIRNSEKKLRLILNSLTDMIIEIDSNMNILWANKTVLDLVPDVVGKKCFSMFAEERQKCEGCFSEKALETGKISSGIIYHPSFKAVGESYWENVAIPLKGMNRDQITVLEVSRDVTERVKVESEKETLIKDLKKALTEVRTLSGLLPICASCKKIRDDKGYWNSIEAYIEKHSDASFSHGICAECSDKLYGDEDWYIEMKTHKKTE